MTAGRRYLLFLAALAGLTLVLLAVGYLPTRSLAGQVGARAMLLGCAVCFVGSVVGGVPIALAGRPRIEGNPGIEGLKLFTASMVLRLLVVAVLAGAVIVLLGPERKAFLLWLAISYLVLLAADTGYANAVLRRL